MTLVSPKTSPVIWRAKSQPEPRKAKRTDGSLAKVIARYEAALKLMHNGKYARAHDAFQELLPDVPPGFGDRVHVYLAVCSKKCVTDKIEFHDSDERFDYAVLLLNSGRYREARMHLDDLLLQEGRTAQILYGFALLDGGVGETDKCIGHLAEAISLDEQYRLKAFYESDFEDLADDPGFRELLVSKQV